MSNIKELEKKFKKAQESLVIQQSDFSLSSICDMVESDSIDLTPPYQRRDRWNEEKQSRLIESFLLNVPVPPVYLSEEDYGSYSVIDGKQRITAITRFIGGKLRLTGVKELQEINGLYFKDLPDSVRNALKIRPYIRAITILRQSDSELKYEVFLRLNTAGEGLKPQEIRNVAFSGKLNNLLEVLAKNPILKKCLKIDSESSNSYKKMEDIEHVLRFFTLRQNWRNMRGQLAAEMDQYMRANRNPDQNEIQNLQSIFENSITNCQEIWGGKIFAKPLGNNQWRSQLISPLYDAEMVAISMLSPAKLDKIKSAKQSAIDGVENLYEDKDFRHSVLQATNTPSSIVTRIQKMYDMLDGIGS